MSWHGESTCVPGREAHRGKTDNALRTLEILHTMLPQYYERRLDLAYYGICEDAKAHRIDLDPVHGTRY